MRFIFNFIFFGVLFYLINVYFPDAFHTLVSWADHIFVFFRDLVLWGVDKFKGTPTATPTTTPIEAPKAVASYIMMMIQK